MPDRHPAAQCPRRDCHNHANPVPREPRDVPNATDWPPREVKR